MCLNKYHYLYYTMLQWEKNWPEKPRIITNWKIYKFSIDLRMCLNGGECRGMFIRGPGQSCHLLTSACMSEDCFFCHVDWNKANWSDQRRYVVNLHNEVGILKRAKMWRDSNGFRHLMLTERDIRRRLRGNFLKRCCKRDRGPATGAW